MSCMRPSHHILRSLSSLAPPPIKEPTPPPPLHSLLSLLTRCSTPTHIGQAHAFMLSRGLDRDNLLLSKFIHACTRLSLTSYAYTVFHHKERPDVYLYNTMIRCLSQTDAAPEAIHLFTKILAIGFRPDTYTFPFVLKAVAHLSDLLLGQEIHAQIIRYGLCSDTYLATGLIHMYCSCKDLCCARKILDEIPQRDVVVWNAMIAGHVKLGDVDNARELFEQMHERNVISWTTVIAGYAQMNRPDEALVVFRRMQLEDGIEPDEITLLAVLSACAHLGALDLGEWVYSFLDKRGLYKIVPLMNALIDMYAKCGNIEKALDVFENMKHRNVVTWTTMIAGFAFHGLGNEALKMFNRMEGENVRPNEVTFLAVLSACSHIGQTSLGRWYFNHMNSWYKIKPKIEHYGCMVDLLGRAGCLQEARDLVRDMPFEANAAIWGALLAAARLHGDLDVGEHALRHLIEVEPHNSGNYTLLSNMYAAHGKWKEAGELRKVMKDRGLNKVPGGSSIEVNGTVHEFTARDGSHPHFESIYAVLCKINCHLKMTEYIPKSCGGLHDFEKG